MATEQIKVVVVRYPDRKSLVMRYVDPVSGRQQSRSTRTTNRREAERIAAKWEVELQAGRFRPSNRISWDEFRLRYEREKLASLSEKTAEATGSAFNHLERIINPARLNVLTAPVLSHFQAELRGTGISEASVATHLRHLRAALNWAVSMELLTDLPRIEMPKRARGQVLMRGRPITVEEFERLLEAAPKVRKRDGPSWQRYLQGLWLSGLRLKESLVLSWDEDMPISLDFSGRHPRMRIYAEAEKGHQDRLLPITPDLCEFLLQTPKDERSGAVFQLIGYTTRKPLSAENVSRVISAIGKKAGVIVNKAEGKFASAHDLRRCFGTRWAQRVKPATLQLLMRHRSIETTMKYYVGLDADDVADELWQGYRGSNAQDGEPLKPGAPFR